MKAVVLLSGGLDSATTAAIAKADGYEVHALSFDYAQRHRVELESARRVAESLGIVDHLFIKFDLREIGGSALTSDIEVPKDRIGESGVIPVTYVPARNTIFLSFALSWAEVLEAPHIFIGANAIDYSGYPDCRPEYFRAFEVMSNLSTKISVEGKIHFKIHAPLISLTKAGIIEKGSSLGLDYAQTWSCYDPQKVQDQKESESRGIGELEKKNLHFSGSQFYVPCGRCDSCILRAKGFREAGLSDPLDRLLLRE
ncbi:MAG TPA: 7-cyano-7-deazaguanine synthase QueC [Dissulfurispiraceae bacterium]|nr:7-cyano-7-deazaguanine synthase QueC [Dissulfurispiraceae bacterium]